MAILELAPYNLLLIGKEVLGRRIGYKLLKNNGAFGSWVDRSAAFIAAVNCVELTKL
jgi:hypothetical protein